MLTVNIADCFAERDGLAIQSILNEAIVNSTALYDYEPRNLKVVTAWLDQKIDEMLASKRFFIESQDRTDPNVIAFRILGELFDLNRSGDNKPEFFRQIRRVLPTRSDAEYQELHRYALNEWMEAYGF